MGSSLSKPSASLVWDRFRTRPLTPSSSSLTWCGGLGSCFGADGIAGFKRRTGIVELISLRCVVTTDNMIRTVGQTPNNVPSDHCSVQGSFLAACDPDVVQAVGRAPSTSGANPMSRGLKPN